MKSLIKIFFVIILIQNIVYAEKIKLIKEGGVYSVPVMINDSIKLNFVVDSGAARISMPYDVFRTLIRTGSIKKNDILGKEQYRMANGSIEEGTVVNIRAMKIGTQTITNVLASVDKHMDGMLLLGQTALQKLEPWQMDTKKGVIYIKITKKEKRSKKGLKLAQALMGTANTQKKSSQSCYSKDKCLILAHDFYYGVKNKKQDYQKAIKFYIKACNYGDAFSCSEAADMYYYARGIKKDEVKAAELYSKACDGGHMESCSSLAKMYNYGYGIKEDKVKAKEFYSKGCDGGHMESCHNLGGMYGFGGNKQGKVKAKELFGKGCDGGHMTSCLELGSMHSRGDGIKQDKAKAKELYSKACDGGNMTGCSSLAHMYKTGGDGIKQDKAKAIELYSELCDGSTMSSMMGCHDLAHMYKTGGDGIKQDKAKAKELFGKACDGGFTISCERYKILDEEGVR